MSMSEQICHEFSLDEIKTATRNFDEELIIGKGGFGVVYKGSINNGAEVVAIKRLSIESKQGETEFLREIETLSKLQHPHLVHLKGYCNQSQELILVYEYMPNGTLVDHLYKIKDLGSQQYGLSWEQRLNICIGAARGVDFLHREHVPGIIHRDIKDSNILLDANFVAKIADFGLAKLVKSSSESQTTIVSSTGVKGTFGYLDPDYFYTQRLTKKTDVYAFGVLLLVVLCGRPAVSNKATEDQRSLALWAEKCIQKNRVDEIIDPHLAGNMAPKSLKQFLKVSQRCLLRQSELRPTMEEVVLGLELALKKQSKERSSLTQMVTKLQIVWAKKQSGLVAVAGKEKLEPSASVTEVLRSKFSVDEMKRATQNFFGALIIPESSSGLVYKGRLDNGSEVAIKRLTKDSRTYILIPDELDLDEDLEIMRSSNNSNVAYPKGNCDDGKDEFMREIETLYKLQHDNVACLKGYCEESPEKVIVYEYTSNCSIDRHLCHHGDNKQARLTWEQRLNICICAARGLDYIHHVLGAGIVHCNVKCSNIMLDDKLVPKISILGMSILNDDDIETRVTGTAGYIDPEYVSTGRVTRKSDVYSFGVVMLVVLSGIEVWGNDANSHLVLPVWAMKCIKDNKTGLIIDPYIRRQIKIESLEQFLKTVVQCLLPQSEHRPTFEEVVLSLEIALEFQLHSTSTQLVESI